MGEALGGGLTGIFGHGTGATRPGVNDLGAFRLRNVGGLTTNVSKKGKVRVKSSAERRGLVGEVSSLLSGGAEELSGIRDLVRPGFSAFRRAGLESIGTRARRSIGNLRENLARRRVQGSSFAEDAVTRAEREFAQEESQFAAATTLQEIDVFTQLTQQITQQQVAAVERQVQELNLQLDVGLQLAGAATQSLTAASIQQQKNAAATVGELFDIAGIAAAGGFACAIAREVYGTHDPRWMAFRHWLFHEAPAWFFRWYLGNQYRVAEWLRGKPPVKRIVRYFMNRIIAGGT